MKHLLYTFLIVSLLLAGCDYLDIVPENDIETVETIFEQRAKADEWLAGVYAGVMSILSNVGGNVSYLGSDEFVTNEYVRNKLAGFKIASGLQMSQEPFGNVWDEGTSSVVPSLYESLRYCNVFLEEIDKVYNMEVAEKRQWAAEMKALKACIYFELVRRYGPIVLVPENLPVDISTTAMQKQRSHVDTCFNAIVSLLDEATEDLLPGNEKTQDRAPYFARESALALKARVLLYAASPLFNGNEFYSDFKDKDGKPLFSTEYDPEKWRLAAEAADVAVRECEAFGHKLYNGSVGRGSELLNVMYDIENSVKSQFSNSEFLLQWKDLGVTFYSMCLPLLESSDEHYRYNAWGCVSPSMKMVEMYYTENGLPIDVDKTWNYAGRYHFSTEANGRYAEVIPFNTNVLQLHLRREPRFYACIAADRTNWQRGPTSKDNLLVEAYRGERFGSQYENYTSITYQNICGYWLKKHSYSEQQTKKYSVGPNECLPVFRLAELYLMQAEAWNEYLSAPDYEHVYDPLNKVRKRAGIPDVVTAWKSYSNTPDKVDTKIGMREIIRRETNIELAFEGHRFWNLRRWKIAHEEMNKKQYGWNVLGETAQAFYNNFEGPVEVGKCKFTAPRDYLFPIKAEEILISSMVQNLGW